MKASEEFYDFCVRHEACHDGLAAIAGLTAEEWWNTTNRGDWMLWLDSKGAWKFSRQQKRNYRAKRDALYADYEAKRAPLYADYKAKRALLYADYAAKRDALDADYEAKCDALYADYDAKRASLIRDIIGNPFSKQPIVGGIDE